MIGWRGAFAETDTASLELKAKRDALLVEWAKDPWSYISGKDTDGKPIIWTTDERDDVNPVKAFPEEKEYLKWLTEELWHPDHRIVLVDKARQMYVSTLSCLIIDWYCTFKEDREVIVSRVKEESAIKLINDKIRTVHRRKPQWLQDYVKMSSSPEAVITYGCSGSTVTAVAQNFAHSDSRGITGSLIIVDEAAYQDYFPAIYQSVLPMSNRLWAVTTAHLGNQGAALFKALKDEGKENHQPGPSGCNAYDTPRGIRVIELDFWADTNRDENWEKREKKLYASDKDWRRENLRDWTSAEGDVFYPEFVEVGKKKFIIQMPALAKMHVVRSFDFGFRRPACTWLQYAAGSDRVWWIREFMPHDLGTHDFRDAVQYLSGLFDYDALTPRAKDWIKLYASKPGAPQPPWFPSTTDFFDVSGPESYRTEASAIRATEEANAAQVFANGGIYLNMVDPPVKARVDIIRRLLKMRHDGWPGLIIDPQCEEGIEMFNGALSFENMTKENPIPSKPKKDGHYENIHDALGYGIVAVVPMEDRKPGDVGRTVVGYDGRRPIYAPPGEDLGFYETRSNPRPWQTRGRRDFDETR